MRLGVIFFMAAAALNSTERLEFERGDQSQCEAYYDLPEGNSFPLVLMIPGSQQESSLVTHNALKNDILAKGKAFLSLEKRGVGDEKEFIAHLSLDERVQDHLLLIKKLQAGAISQWNGKLVILGQGDGGRIGASLAAQIDNVAQLILIGSGGAWPPLQEALHSFRSEMADGGYSPQYIQGFMVQARQQFREALKSPTPERKAFGYSYKYWGSLLKMDLLESLSKLKCPIYTMNGELDERVPIESVEALAKCMDITVKRKAKMGREILKDPNTYKEALSWLD
jgi:hypothetical protein